MIRINNRLIAWVAMGFPIYTMNYAVFAAVVWLTQSTTLAYWSWVLTSPISLKMWDFIDARMRREV